MDLSSMVFKGYLADLDDQQLMTPRYIDDGRKLLGAVHDEAACSLHERFDNYRGRLIPPGNDKFFETLKLFIVHRDRVWKLL